jgi:hypothetical protein
LTFQSGSVDWPPVSETATVGHRIEEECQWRPWWQSRYPDEDTAEQVRASVWQLEEELIIQADQVAVISRALG